ncbi:cyclin-dependent kinase G-1 [Blumeria hordei DH14]|uniref:cyclin-dependent kinase n=1 Tax=Blumeria graminis f. sp. hordei (strain DH14) TaxID=546991 RepID=N1JHQ7_BLUG1|nr:cyclin-dependent kinase G-1 [Blumeria hordei DH14]
MNTLTKSRWTDDGEKSPTQVKATKNIRGLKRHKAERQCESTESTAEPVESSEPNSNSTARAAKRLKLPSSETRTPEKETPASTKLLRFPAPSWQKCRSIEEYEKLNDIEEGSYGWVSRAKDTTTGEVVVVKRLKMDTWNSGIPLTGLREIQILRDCEHQNILKLREVVVGEDENKIENIFIVLDFIEHDLHTLLQDMSEPFLVSEIKTILLQLISGVSYLHTHWILHRDLKTSNLLLNNRGVLKIADFGMARYFGDPRATLTHLVVTVWYRAPELILGVKDYGTSIDTWSIGCIFGELLAKEPLIQGKDEIDQLSKIFEICGTPTQEIWPGFKFLPNARLLRLPQTPIAQGSVLRAKFPFLTTIGSSLLIELLSLNPAKRPKTEDISNHAFFREDPKPKSSQMFPTFPSKAGQEKRHRMNTPNAPLRENFSKSMAPISSDIFARREDEERGSGFSLRLI